MLIKPVWFQINHPDISHTNKSKPCKLCDLQGFVLLWLIRATKDIATSLV